MKTATTAAFFLAFSSLASSDTAYLFQFWPGKHPERDARYESMGEHPCSKVVVARVTAIPPVTNSGPFQPDLVQELDPRGKVLRTWAIPVDATPVAVRGVRLLFSAGTLRLWVSPNGALESFAEKNAFRQQKTSPCPPTSGKSADSAHQICRQYRDLTSGRFRLLRFQGPCT